MKRGLFRSDDQRIIFDEQRRVGGDRCRPPRERIFSESDVETENPVVDRVIDVVAELDQNARVADETHTREIIGQECQPANARKVIPKSASADLSRWAI